MTPQEAYRKVRTAIKNGVLARASNCQKCGVADSPTRDGRTRIHAHHEDYCKPLDVEWLCAKCHRAVTPLPEVMGAPVIGTANGASRLNEELVREIRASAESPKRIAKRLGVDKMTIKRVRRGVHWGHVR